MKVEGSPKLHIRGHDSNRVRIWTDEMQGYGQFNVEQLFDVETLHQLLGKMGLGCIIVHHCDGFECDCPTAHYAEKIADLL